MDITDLVQGSIGKELINGLSQQTGLEDNKVSSAVSMALPFLLSQMNKNASDPRGAESLANALSDHKDLNNVSSILNSPNMAEGLGILGHVFGDKQPQVAQSIGKNAGISSGNVMQILATLAPIVMGYLGKQKAQNNMSANEVPNLLENLLGGMKQTNHSEMSMIERMLDQNGDGSIMDEAMDLGGKLLGGFFSKK
ncbi:DUF937 domain-containing protein [Flavobacteriaceae bacterium Ap0902]|nr:DUF937 domain-containing protein [Flavobacteriaceae bacterium Ap0902]